ncbi:MULTISPECIES: PadR family transcriptional regulator [Streptococcus]|uniref:PadR family transcriptional regulator n=1 Tax=Streptococcus caledonicus TaxID=2614158 RepID=A0ABW0UBV5_9STRE|nr:PadR family transcriptional regulator [Streptococcus sp. S784/96/1]
MYYPIPSPVIEFLVLGIVAEKDSYGYEISQTLKMLTSIKESTLYPILKKMELSGYLETYSEAHQGRQRKYYRRTALGSQQFTFLEEEWLRYSAAILDMAKGKLKK